MNNKNLKKHHQINLKNKNNNNHNQKSNHNNYKFKTMIKVLFNIYNQIKINNKIKKIIQKFL